MPRSLEQRKIYKANEFRNWLLYYAVPCLRGILPLIFLKHFGLLSNSIYLLLKTTISEEDINISEQNINEFVKRYEEYYGSINMTYNMHLLLHLPQCVRENGPLWSYSNFHFETNNGVFKNFVRGTSDVMHQTVAKYLYSQILNYVIDKTDIIEEYDKALANKNQDSYQEIKMSSVDNGSINLLIENNIPLENLKFYNKIIYNNIILGTENRSNSIKTNDSCIALHDNRYGKIKAIYNINNVIKCVIKIYKPEATLSLESELCNHIINLVEADETQIIDLNIEWVKCVEVLSNNNVVLAIKPPNNFEKD